MARSATRRRFRKRWLAYAAGGALVATGAVIAIGPAAPWVVDQLGDGARVWRLGHLQIEGVSGRWLGDLSLERLTIEDEQGVWLEAHNVRLRWSPQDIPFGAVRLHDARASNVWIFRRPVLLERQPSTDTTFDVRIGALEIGRIDLAEPVVGEQGQFTAELSLDFRDEVLHGLNARLRRLDSDDDRLIAVYNPGRRYALDVDIASAPGGVIARALGVPEQGFVASALGQGDAEVGSADYEAAVGDAQVLTGTAQWNNARWTIEAAGRLDLLPATASLARRLGPSFAIDANAVRGGGAFDAHAETPFLAIDLEGALDQENQLEGPARFVATTQRLSDIARESPFDFGAARLEGELRRARGTTAIRGVLHAQQIDALGRTTSLRGPVAAALTDARFTLTGDLRAPTQTAALFANGRLRADLHYDRERRRFELTRATLESDAMAVDAQGWVTRSEGEFAGEWRLRRLAALAADLTGEAAGRWRALRSTEQNRRIWTAVVDGRGARIDGSPEVVPQLLGARPELDARFRYENGGITVSHARINGEQLRAGATGRIVRGNADLALEASARGPLNVGGAEIQGAVDATGRLTGRLARPTLSATASMSSFSAGGVVVHSPVVDFTLAPADGRYAGHARVTGSASGQPLEASANVAIEEALSLTNLDAQWGGLLAQGSARIASAGISATLDLNGAVDGLVPGVTGRLVGDLALTPQSLTLSAHISDARAGELRVRAATLQAQGPLDAVAATFELRGRLRRAPLAFGGAALADFEGGTTLQITGAGALADAEIATRTPIEARFSDGRVQASLDMTIGEGAVRAQWAERGRALEGSAQIERAPLAPLAAIWGERASGLVDGRVALDSSGRGLSGEADITLNDARIAGRQRGTLDMRIVADLQPGRLTANVDATSSEGLVASIDADAPVVTSADPIRIALAPERRGRARWSIHGPAANLWSAVRLPDQSLEGQLDGEGELAFGAGYLAGDGHIQIVDGRFADKLTGVTLTDLDARIAIDQRGVTIETFTATSPSGGRLTATGGSANPREGAISVTIDDMRIADRPDARARASGELALEWEGMQSTLSGDLEVLEAEIDVAADPEAGIPTIDVIEINRPGVEDEIEEEADAPQRNGSTALNISIEAPGRVFTRGRGINAEWSLDLRLRGTAQRPLLYGQARAIRGTIALSGQPFEIEEARIDFDGAPLDARIDLRARRDTADLTAYLHLAGSARDPEVSFTSDPGLPEDEILPQVLFGRSVEDLSALEAAQLAASLATLSGQASLDFVDAARAAAGLDRFSVRQDEQGGFLVAGGVYLTSDVYLEVARTGLGETRTTVEWTIRPRLVLITSFLDNGNERISLRWRRESD